MVDAIAGQRWGGAHSPPNATRTLPPREAASTALAIIGIGCRFPGGVKTPGDFWRLLSAGRDAITEVPRDRFDIDHLYDPARGVPGKICSRFGGFIDEIAGFDHAFFGLSRREASRMDPQQRLALEVAWEALEDGGQVASAQRHRRVGVFLGMIASDYSTFLLNHDADPDVLSYTGGALNAGAGRISHLLGFNGPSMVVDADRASSLVAVHLACQSLRTGACELALAGATNLILSPVTSIAFSRSGMLAPDGRCKFGGANADGFVRSDGVGMVVLKPLPAALAAGDPIYAVILGSAVLHAGQTSQDMMTPSVASQVELLLRVCADAGVSPETIDYVEAHGPGTTVGDPIEVEAIGTALARGRAAGHPCLVGSVKTNIGHAEAAAGMAGLIKVALAAREGFIPPSLHGQPPNPHIPFTALGVEVVSAHRPWPDRGASRLAAVNSFGLTGTIASVVIAQAPLATGSPSRAPAGRGFLLPLSARTARAVEDLARRYRDFCAGARAAATDPAALLYRICSTASARREHGPFRGALVAESLDQLIDDLEIFSSGHPVKNAQRSQVLVAAPPRLAFVFSGHGSQWAGMGRSLLTEEPVFRAAMEQCDERLRAIAGWSLLEKVTAAALGDLDRFDLMQPAIFAIQVSLARLWQHWGVLPGAVVGHSFAEITAAHLAEILSLEDALSVVVHRSLLMQQTSRKGGMAVAVAPVETVRALLAPFGTLLEIAAINAPTNTVFSGEQSSIEAAVEELNRQGVECRKVRVSVAGHSFHMEPLRDALQERLVALRPVQGRIPFYSTVTGGILEGPALTPAYWARNLREPVRFASTIRQLLLDGFTTFVEVSPHPIQVEPMLECIQSSGFSASVHGSLVREQDERCSLLASLGGLYCRGLAVDWAALCPAPVPPLHLPTYPWQRTRLWHQVSPAPAAISAPGWAVDPAGPAPRSAPELEQEPAPSRLLQELAGANPRERREVLTKHLRVLVAHVVGLPDPTEVDIRRPLREVGLRSVMAVELRATLGQALQRELPVTLLFNFPTVEALADHLAGEETPASGPLGQILSGHGAEGEAKLDQREPIAIVGAACRFPGGANTLESYWRLLRTAGDGTSEVPRDRWSIDDYYDADRAAPGKIYTRRGGYLRGVALADFDAEFFGIAPREASRIDPQQRLLLEVTWEALAHAGLATRRLAGSRTGVFIGMTHVDFALQLGQGKPLAIDAYLGLGAAPSVASGRISYLLGLQGPCMTIDTACSSSLVAIHLALQSLRAGESDLALVGGVNVLLRPEPFIYFCRLGALSPDGRCKVFDAAADGYARGEGCGVVVLKRLSEARASGDQVLAVILGSAVNQDGRSSGLTVPNGLAQQRVIHEALVRAGVEPMQVDYVEAHGTGTALGDPIEVQALAAVLGQGRPRNRPLLIGSAKANIGHLEPAAGIAGLIKVILALQHDEIPPLRALQRLNPALDWSELGVVVPTERAPWCAGDRPRTAGISGFAWSGTNAHLIVCEAPAVPPPASDVRRPRHLLALSAKGEPALAQVAARMAEHLQTNPHLALADVCHAANVGRDHDHHRLALTASTAAEMQVALLESVERLGQLPTSTRDPRPQPRPPRLAFIFSGQGSQYTQMGRQLYETLPAFREVIDRCAGVLDKELPRPLLSVLFADPPGAQADLDQTLYTQTALFAMEYALSQVWQTWGIQPDVVLGHGIGEFAAACLAGVFDLETALRLVAARARLMQALPPGGAMAVALARPEQIASLLQDHAAPVSVAAINAPEETVISGAAAAIADILQLLRAQEIRTRPLKVSHAFHSPLMQPMVQAFRQLARGCSYSPPKIPFIANVTGERLRQAPDDEYWAQQIVHPILFARSVATVHSLGCDAWLEIGPQDSLLLLVSRCLPRGQALRLASLRRAGDDWTQLLEAVGALYCAGADFDWRRFDEGRARRRCSLPPYPWQRRRHWLDEETNSSPLVQPATGGSDDAAAAAGHSDGAEALPVQLLVLSAASAPALRDRARALRDLLEHDLAGADEATSLGDLCFTASQQRAHLAHRLALVGRTGPAFAETLSAFLAGEELAAGATGQALTGRPRVAFVFSGQGSQWPGMGRDLARRQPVFRQALLRAGEQLRPHVPWSLLEELDADAPRSRLGENEVAQVALVAVQLALVDLLRAWGVVPDVVVGHSVGEISAAQAAGILSLEEALALAAERGRLTQTAAGQGRMASVALERDDLVALLPTYRGALVLAAENGPWAQVVSGTGAAITALLAELEQRGVRCRDLGVNYPSHSPLMAVQSQQLRRWAEGRISAGPASLRLISTVTGEPCAGEDMDAAYWGNNLREPVRLRSVIDGLLEAGTDIFVEISPRPVLGVALSQCLATRRHPGQVLSTLREVGDHELLDTMAGLYVSGYPLRWSRLYPRGAPRDLPADPGPDQPLEIGSCPSPPPVGRTTPLRVRHPLLGHRLLNPQATFALALEGEDQRFLQDHRLGDMPVLPAAAVLELALAAHAESHPSLPVCLRSVALPRLLPLAERRHVQLQIDDRGFFQIHSCADGSGTGAAQWTLHAGGSVSHVAGEIPPATSADPADSLGRCRERCPEPAAVGEYYEKLGTIGLEYGPSFRRLVAAWVGPGEALGEIAAGDEAPTTGAFLAHPALLDACLQLVGLAVNGRSPPAAFLLPVALESLSLRAPLGNALWCSARLRPPADSADPGRLPRADLTLYDGDANTLAVIDGLSLRPVRQDELEVLIGPRLDLEYEIRWEPRVGQPVPPPADDQRWLVLSDGELGPAVMRQLTERGAQVVEVVPEGSSWPTAREDARRLAPLDLEGWRRLLDTAPCQTVLHLWGLPRVAETAEGLIRGLERSVGALHTLLRALAATGVRAKTWVVTHGAQAVREGADLLRADQAPLWGFGRAVNLELPELWGGLVDLDPLAALSADRLLAAIGGPGGDPELALRGAEAWVSRLVHRPPSAAGRLAVRDHASYLITGGLGDLGLLVARTLVRRGARRLVLVGRRPPDARHAERLAELRALGATVETASADVTRAEEVRRVVELGGRQLRGVVHAAGLLDDGLLVNQTWDRVVRVMAPKIQGTVHLAEATARLELDWLVLFSSTTAVLGSPAQTGYAAGNAFLDAFAHQGRQRGLKTHSISWGPWANLGMTRHLTARDLDRFAKLGIRPLSAEEGEAAFDRLLDQDVPQTIVLAARWKHAAHASSGEVPPLLAAQLGGAGKPSGEAEQRQRNAILVQLSRLTAKQRKKALLDEIRLQVASVMGFAPSSVPDPTRPLLQAGMDSLMMMGVTRRLQARLCDRLMVTDWFKYTTMEAFSDYLDGLLFPADQDQPMPAVTETAAAAEGRVQRLAAHIENLSEEDVEQLLNERLACRKDR